MDEIIKTALLYISDFLSVSAMAIDRGCSGASLPSPYASEAENNIISRLLTAASGGTAYYMEDRMMFHYCLALVSNERAVVIGPYRLAGSSKIASQSLFADKEDHQSYKLYFRELPSISDEKIKLAVHLMFVAVYGDEFELKEQDVVMKEYARGEIPIIATEELPYSSLAPLVERDELFYYIAQIRSGNYRGAMTSFHRIMRSRGQKFVLVNSIEGLSALRTLTHIGLDLAGVPEDRIREIFAKFRLKGRALTNIGDATRLSEGLIQESCELVQRVMGSGYSPGIRAAISYIHSNISDPLTVTDISAQANLSPNRFTTKFHEEVGVPPMTYVMRQRMRMAAQLLSLTNMSIQHICTNVGIFDSAYFTRCFKKEYNMSPTDYRKRNCADDTLDLT